MSRRNFILLIIVLTLVIAITFGLWFFRQGGAPGEEGTGGTNFISQFNPFGNGGGTKPPSTTPPADISDYEPEDVVAWKLRKVSSMPIAGYTVYQKERLKEVPLPPAPVETVSTSTAPSTAKPTPPPTEFFPSLRYVARVDGNIYQTFADKIVERKFSTTVIPKVYEALFGPKGESVVMRYLNQDDRTIETFVGTLPKEVLGGDTAMENEVKGSFLPEGIQDISLSGDTTSLFYLFESGESMIGTTLSFLTNKKAQVFDSAFTEWLSSWPNSKMVTLTTKPSASVPGYMYALDPTAKNLSNVFGGINGLTTLTSPSGKLVLYADNNLSVGIYHTDTKVVDALSIKTMPDKCLWGKLSDVLYCSVPKFVSSGGYPDLWYQGEESFADQVWKIDIETGNATLLVNPSVVAGEEIDGIKLSTDEGENYLFFVNKKDSFLWELALK